MLQARKMTLFAKRHTTYTTDPVPTGAANAILAHNVKLTPMAGEDVARDIDVVRAGANETMPAELHMRMTFEVEFAASGVAGTAPLWGPLARACGLSETIVAATSVTYGRADWPHDAVAMYFQLDSRQFKLLGARGNIGLMVEKQKPPRLKFDFLALYQAPTDQTFTPGDTTAWPKTAVATSTNTPTFTVGGYAAEMSMVDFDAGNAVAYRGLIGRDEIIIGDRAPTTRMQVNAKALATFNPYAIAAARTPVPVVLQHGTTAGQRATLNLPNFLLQRPGELANVDGVLMEQLNGLPLQGNAGNDDFTLVLT